MQISCCLFSLVLGACGGATRTSDSPVAECVNGVATGPIVLRDEGEVAALEGCRAVVGNLTIATGVDLSLAPLRSLIRVSGDLSIGPTIAVSSLEGLTGLTEVGGNVVLEQNFGASGIYLSGLEQIGGSLRIAGNPAAENIAINRLVKVGGSLWINDNASLERLDLSSLQQVVGDLVVLDNRRLSQLEGLAAVSTGGVHIVAPGRAQVPPPQ